MKKLFTTLFITFLALAAIAQSVPQGMKYQAVARDHQGQILADQEINLRIDLVLDGKAKDKVYTETHQVTTNELGLFAITIGQGRQISGDFTEVPWSENEIWMQIGLDESGKGQYETISSSRLLAVPYAFHAGSAEKLAGSEEGGTRNGSVYWHVLGNTGTSPLYAFIGTKDYQDFVMKTNNTEVMRLTAQGEVVMDGDLSVGNNALIGNDLDVINDASIGNDMEIGNDLNVDGIARFNNTTQSTGKDDGAVIVEGGVGIEKNTNIGGNLGVSGITNLKNATESTSKDDGALVVEGGVGIEKNLNVGGTSKLNGQVTIDASLQDAAAGDNYDRYPLQVQGSGQGIAINVENISGSSSGRSNNYVSFWKGDDNMTGRIEGMNAFDLDPTGLTDLIFSDFLSSGFNGNSFSFDLIDILSVSGNTSNYEDDADDYENTVPNQTEIDNFNSQIFSNYTLDIILATTDVIKTTIMFAASVLSILDPEDVFSTGVDLTVEVVNIGIYVVYNYVNLGVAYESGAGDYAEWLERENAKEILSPGDVVGVVGGKISKEFTEAEKFMVISSAPALLGNMPENPELEELHEKVAFMGQVPVKVIGEANIGDYILPSGNGDGFAMAVHPDDMQARDYARIIGIAWEESDGKKAYKYINTAVGINSNDTAKMLEDMQSVMNEMQMAIQEVNPNYQPQLFQISDNGQPNLMADSYSVSPSMNDHIVSQLNLPENADLQQRMQALKQYAYDNGAGEYLESFPYMTELMDNPNDMELVQKVIGEYTVALQNAQMLVQAMEDARGQN